MTERKLVTIFTSEDNKEIPVPEKPKIDDKSLRSIILFKERTFDVPDDMVSYLAYHPDNLPSRVQRTRDSGLDMMYPDGSFSCAYCRFYSENVQKHMESHRVLIYNLGGTPGMEVVGCRYKQGDVRWATTFGNKRGRSVIAERTPCLVYDCMIADLMEKGLLDEYEVHGREFNFPKISQLIEESRKKASKGIINRLKNLFRRKKKDQSTIRVIHPRRTE